MEYYLIISIIVGTIVFFLSIGITICIWICICCKACKPPKFEEVPVTGHPLGLSVIPVFNYRYFLRSESTVLKLREKYFSWSGDDCTVKVLILVLRLCTANIPVIICLVFIHVLVPAHSPNNSSLALHCIVHKNKF